MATPIKPVAKSVAVCDDIMVDPQSGKVSLLNLWDAVQVPEGESFPYRLKRVCVFAWWRSGLGRLKTWIEIVQASSGTVIRRTRDCTLTFEVRTTSVFASYRIEDCVFPEPGSYIVELFCEGEFVDDMIIEVSQPRS